MWRVLWQRLAQQQQGRVLCVPQSSVLRRQASGSSWHSSSGSYTGGVQGVTAVVASQVEQQQVEGVTDAVTVCCSCVLQQLVSWAGAVLDLLQMND